jgi:tRNAThr (cytosine32-N3)-methyltransferase
MESSQANGEPALVETPSSLTAQDSSLATGSQQQIPPHLSHDPENSLKRSDPFQFGSRLLSQEDNVFEFNAWDHVETDDTYKEYAELQYTKQREAPVSDFDKSMYFFPSSLGGHPCAT